MQNKFVDTSNFLALQDAMSALTTRNETVPGLGLIYGLPGMGKTRSVHWYYTQFGGVYLRANPAWTTRWMLQDLAAELGQDPERYTDAVYKQVKSLLLSQEGLIFVDEAESLTSDRRMLETLRALHDETGAAFVLVGMGNIEQKLARFAQVDSRISQRVEFKPLTAEEVAFVAFELTGLNLEAGTAEQLVKATSGHFRYVMVALAHLERMAIANKTQNINRKMVDMTAAAALKQRRIA